jgi:CelD/BcsL family acetyltransferase involved in cellulose biosynthesis
MRFHQALVRRLWEANAVDLLRLSAGDADIGYLYNFKARGKVYAFQSGFAYAPDARLKPGLVTHACAMEHYARDGWREYDFLAGDARYKRSFASRSRTLLWTTTYRDKRWMRAVVRAWRLKARLAPAEAPA